MEEEVIENCSSIPPMRKKQVSVFLEQYLHVLCVHEKLEQPISKQSSTQNRLFSEINRVDFSDFLC